VQRPQLADTAEAPPGGQGWLCKIKLDGYRILAIKDQDRVRLLTRKGHDWADRLPALARAVATLADQTAMLDGELVALRADGLSSFPDLQASLSTGQDSRLHYFAFDLLHLNGWDLRPCRLADRKRVLSGLGTVSGHAALQRPHRRRAAENARASLRDGGGGHPVQARRRAVSRRTQPILVEGEVPGPRGFRRHWLDPAGRQPGRHRRPAAGVL
jgi:ATP-dependent DNA ligase